jgi:hypothetical protein
MGPCLRRDDRVERRLPTHDNRSVDTGASVGRPRYSLSPGITRIAFSLSIAVISAGLNL